MWSPGCPKPLRSISSATGTFPFVQMVLHGSVAYTNDAGNLSSDFDRQLLRWLELGYTPHFVLTYNNAEKLKYTGYNHLFTSRYDRHADKLDKAYALYTDALSKVTGAYMVSHEWAHRRWFGGAGSVR